MILQEVLLWGLHHTAYAGVDELLIISFSTLEFVIRGINHGEKGHVKYHLLPGKFISTMCNVLCKSQDIQLYQIFSVYSQYLQDYCQSCNQKYYHIQIFNLADSFLSKGLPKHHPDVCFSLHLGVMPTNWFISRPNLRPNVIRLQQPASTMNHRTASLGTKYLLIHAEYYFFPIKIVKDQFVSH